MPGIREQESRKLIGSNEGQLICEALVREIGQAKRWLAVVEAWQALLHVRRMEDHRQWEMEKLRGKTSLSEEP